MNSINIQNNNNSTTRAIEEGRATNNTNTEHRKWSLACECDDCIKKCDKISSRIFAYIAFGVFYFWMGIFFPLIYIWRLITCQPCKERKESNS